MPSHDGDLVVPSAQPMPTLRGGPGAWRMRAPDVAALLAGLPDDPTTLVWPSQVWRTHLAECDAPPRKCVHDVPLPDWWVAKVTTGRPRSPLHADPREAVRLAMVICTRFKGGRKASPEGVEFARDAVRDALPIAPQPVSREWVRSSLATIANIATWVHDEGEPLTRAHVFNERTVYRWLHGPTGVSNLDERTKATYRIRIDRIAIILLTSPRVHLPAPQTPEKAPALPLTRQEEADVWVWSQGVRPVTRRVPLQAYISLGLGFGTHRREATSVRGQDITRDNHGVHLALPATSHAGGHLPARTVTCRADWEDRVWAMREAMADPANLFTFPHVNHDRPATRIDNVMRAAQNNTSAPPPRPFNSEGMRNTWILRHLEAGTPLHVLMRHGAILGLTTLTQLVPYMSPVDDTAASILLRFPGRHLE